MKCFTTTVAVLIVGALLQPSTANGQRIPATFVGLRTLGLDDSEVAALDGALKRRLENDEHFAVAIRGDQKLLGRCKGNLHCYCRATRGSRRLIYGNVGRIEAIYSIELVLVDTQNCSVDNAIFVTEKLDRPRASQRIEQLSAKLLTPQETVSKTAAKAERDIDDVPAIVTVMTGKMIEQLGIDRLPELIRLVPGFEIVDTNFGDLVLHHGLASTILYMVDGVPLSNPKVNFGVLGKDFMLGLNSVERVEFIRGPGSVLWGQNAFLGIVNLITRKPRTKTEQVRAHVRLGTLDTQEFHASVGAARRWLSYYLATTYLRTDGPKTRVSNSMYTNTGEGVDEPIWGNAGTTENEADTLFDVTAKVLVANRLEFLFHYATHKAAFEISPYGALLPPDGGGFWDTTEILYAASWTDDLPFGLRYRLSASRYEHHSWENFIVFPKKDPELPEGFSSLQGNELRPEENHQVEGRIYHTLQSKLLTNRALLGVSFLHQRMPDQFAALTTGQEPGREELDIVANQFVTISAYAQDDLSILDDRIVVSGGIRYDHHDPFQSALSTQAALIGGVPALRAKLVYAEGFRPPSMNSLYSTKGVFGNQNLKPEHSRAISLQLKSQPFGPLTVTVGGTMAMLTDLIVMEKITDQALQDKGFTIEPVNRDSTEIFSGHAEVRLSWQKFNAFATYTFKHLETDEPRPFANHTASIGLSLRPLKDLNAFATGSFVSAFPVQVVLPKAPDGVEEMVDARLLIDAGFTISNLLAMFDLTIKVRNPLRYSYRSPHRLDGRANLLLEERRSTELIVTLGWSGTVPWRK